MKLAKCVASPEPIFCTVTTTANGHVSMDVLRTHLVHPCANRIWNGRLDLPANATPKPAWTGARCASCAQVKRPHSAWNRFTRRKNMLGVGTRLSPRDLGYPSSSELTDELGGAAVTKTEKDGDNLPSMADIVAAAEEKGVKLELKGWGPFFSVQALSLAGKTLGRAEGFILQWFQEKILHLDWIRLTKESGQSRTSTLGVGLFIGAVAVRHGFDCSCTKAELLAINDSPEFHNKLVRYYNRMGFKAVHEVTGGRLQDIPHMLVWGGVGTRMDAGVRELLQKWALSLRPQKRVYSKY